MSSGHALWYLTRGSGAVSLLMLTASVVLGVLSAGRWRTDRWPRFAVATFHRNLTLLALVFIGVHVGTTLADSYAPIGLKDAVVPFAGQYRPIWLGLGALAFDLLLAVAISSALRRRIGYRTWRVLHWSAYATWPLALAHGLGTGSDARFGWLQLLAFGSLAAVVIAVAVRLAQSGRPSLQLSVGAFTVAAVVLLASWYGTGPAKRGWASRAGTPSSLLKTSVTPAPARSLASSTVPARPRAFRGRLAGHITTSGPDSVGDAAIAIAAAVRGNEPGLVQMTLWGTALGGGGLHMNDSSVSLQDTRTGIAYSGSVVGLEGSLVVADVSSSSGKGLRLTMQLRIDGAGRTVGGTIRAAPARGDEEGNR
jgi:hypothetical protein